MASEFELRVLEELSEIKVIATSAANAARAADDSAVSAVSALNERLFNHGSGVIATLQGDIQEIKDGRRSDARWDKVHNVAHYSLTPILLSLHAIARHFGVDV